MANRTTVKSNIITLNVPSVSNAILSEMLNDELADNIVFREDVAVIQSSSVSSVTVDFTSKDRVELTRTGGSLAVTVSGIGDGETKFLLITKTTGQVVSFVGVTDITPIKTNADVLSLVLYEIVRKGSNYFAKAWVETVQAASSAETQAGTISNKFVTPAALEAKTATTTRKGIQKNAGSAETVSGSSSTLTVTPNSLRYAIRNQVKTMINSESYTVAATVGLVVIPHDVDNCTITMPSGVDYSGHTVCIMVLGVSTGSTLNPAAAPATGLLSNTVYIVKSVGSVKWYHYNVTIDNADGLACPYVYVNDVYVEEILKNIVNLDGEETIDLSRVLKIGKNKITISEEKAEITYMKELFFNGVLLDKGRVLRESDYIDYEINYTGGEAKLTAKGHYCYA